MAQPVNPQSFQPDGEPVPVAEQMASGAQIGFQQFSASENGVLVYQAGQSTDLPQLTWFARSGKELGSVGAPSRIFDFALSPDDKQVAIARADVQLKTSDLWIRDLERGTETRFTSHASINERPVWSADGARIVFSSTRAGRTDLYQKLATGTAQDESVLAGLTAKFAMDLSRDGKLLLYEEGVRSIFVLPLDGGRNPRAVFHSEFRETQPQLSPDGRWLAYVSDESGRNEIYVRPFSMDANAPGGKWPVSNGGGADPRWRRDGQELFFLAADGKLMAAKVKGGAGAGFSTDVPESLFEVPPFFSRVANGSFRYAIAGDGNRFLVLMGQKNAVQPPLTVVTNWESAVKR
jgi:Tol biopolymer transport system component